jgi:DNA-binding response OmpR family regulator
MKILIADDDPVSSCLLADILTRLGHEVVAARDGMEAWQALQPADAPRLVILNRQMPGLGGIELCRRIRATAATERAYVLMLTGMSRAEQIVEGLEAGANDYIAKPFNSPELQARVGVGVRMLELQSEISDRVAELERSLAEVKQLRGILPICGYCKKIRDDHDYWLQLEEYICDHSEATFSHGICPECFERIVKPELSVLGQQVGAPGLPE